MDWLVVGALGALVVLTALGVISLLRLIRLTREHTEVVIKAHGMSPDDVHAARRMVDAEDKISRL